ncbi:MAG TPA: GNAT family protein [Pseudolabrys sp.]|nr:GNAT family protein [Pseudolabrys sp.]
MHRAVMKAQISLRAVTAADLEFLASIRRDIALQKLLLNHLPAEGLSDGEVKEWVARRLGEKGGTFQIVMDGAKRSIGFVQIFDVHQKSRHGKLGMAIVSDARGQGAGREALRLLCDYARANLNLHKISLEVRLDNKVAVHLYERSGFQKVGVLHQHYFDGRHYHDVLLMERLLEGGSPS